MLLYDVNIDTHGVCAVRTVCRHAALSDLSAARLVVTGLAPKAKRKQPIWWHDQVCWSIHTQHQHGGPTPLWLSMHLSPIIPLSLIATANHQLNSVAGSSSHTVRKVKSNISTHTWSTIMLWTFCHEAPTFNQSILQQFETRIVEDLLQRMLDTFWIYCLKVIKAKSIQRAPKEPNNLSTVSSERSDCGLCVKQYCSVEL